MSDGFAVEMRGITKTFGSVVANRDVDLDPAPWRDSGAAGGKRLGQDHPDEYAVRHLCAGQRLRSGWTGKPAVISSPQDAKRLGIGMVHQHFKLVDVLSAADNIWMGAEKAGALLRRDRYEKIAEVARRFGFDIDPRKQVANMAVSEKQTLEIIKVLYYGAKVIILDEPTAVLTVQEIDKLFSVLRRMKEEGHSIIIITHKLNEVMDISDRVAILRKGEYIATVDTASTNEQELTEWMVGRKMDLNIERPVVEKTRPLLEVRDLTVRSDEGVGGHRPCELLHPGRRDPGRGGHRRLRPEGAVRGHCRPAAHPVRADDPQGGQHRGPAPQGHSGQGHLHVLYPGGPAGDGPGPLHVHHGQYAAEKLRQPQGTLCGPEGRPGGRRAGDPRSWGWSPPPPRRRCGRLSGGNVQKVLLGREIKAGPNVIITAYPVRGLDINSSYAIYDILNQQKQDGVGILFVGEDLDVMLALCDKIMVLCHGKVMGVVHAHKTTKEELGLMMTGALDLSHKYEDKPAGIARDTNIIGQERAGDDGQRGEE